MTQHTAEPWKVCEPMEPPSEMIGPVNRGDGPWIVARTVGGNDKANAERIVACVNGCAGINPEAVPELLKTLRSIRDALAEYQTEDADCLTVERVANLLSTSGLTLAKVEVTP